MPNLHLFGTVFSTGAGGAILKPASLPGTVTGTFAGGVARIGIRSTFGAAHDLSLELHVRMQQNGANDFHPTPGPQPQPANALFRIVKNGTVPASAFHLQTGAIEIAETMDDGVELIGGQVAVRIPRAELLIANGLPLAVHALGGAAILDLSANPTLQLTARSFHAGVSGLMRIRDTDGVLQPRRMLESQHESREHVIALDATASLTDLLFDHTGARPMFLHIDVQNRAQEVAAGNAVFAPLGVTQHALRVGLGRTATGTQIESIAAAPANGTPLFLHAFGYAGRRNQHAELAVENAITLHARVGSTGRPGTLLIAPGLEDAAPLAVANRSGDVLHGMVAAHEFRPAATGALVCRAADALPGNAAGVAIAPSIVHEHTTPWLRFAANAGTSMRHAKGGRAFVEGNRISHLDFSGGDVALPLLPKECFQDAPAVQSAHYSTLEATYASHVHALQAAEHETLLKEAPADSGEVKVAELFSPTLIVDLTDVPARREADIRLNRHRVVRDYGRVRTDDPEKPDPIQITLSLDLDPSQPPDYVVIRDDSVFSGGPGFKLDSKSGARLGGMPTSPVRAIAKFSRQFTLEDIIARENLSPQDLGGLTLDRVDEIVRSAGWTGLLLFKSELDFTDMGVLKGLLPPGSLTLEYVALTPAKDERLSINARVNWTNLSASGPPPREEQTEATFRMNRLEAAWRDSELVYFHAEAQAKFTSFFGIDFNQGGNQNLLPDLQIIGSYETKNGTIRFLGKLAEPLPLLPPDFGDLGPIRQVRIRSAEITSSGTNGGRETAIAVDGDLELRPFGFEGEDWFDLGDLPSIDFSSLQIVLPTPNLAPIWTRIRYPSLELRSNSSPFRFGFFELKLQRIAVDWDGIGSFDWGSLIALKDVPDKENWLRNFRFDLRLELMKLPELAAKAIDRLILDFTIAFGLRAGQFRFSEIDMHVGIGAVGFDRLRLDLMRFLELSCDSVRLRNAGGVKRLSFENVVLRIVGETFVDGLSFVLFSADGKEGFLGFMPFGSEDVQTEGALGVYWILAGHNVSLRSPSLPGDELARKLLSVDAPTVQGDNIAIRRAINEAVRDETFLTFDASMNGGGWLFASGFDFFGLFQGKFLFQDRTYYGGVLRGGVFEEWFGKGFAISVLYTRGPRPEQDTLYAALRVPMVVTSAFTFMGGVIALEIVMNGGFTLDVGFPWLQRNGARQWDRALGAIVTPFQGSGGFYVRKYHQVSPIKDQNGEGLLLAGGYAVQFGLGASFGGGVFHVWATIGIYAITEGRVYFEKLRDDSTALRGLALVGAIGIVGRAGGELNWWVISARVEIMISAETRLELRWGRFLPDPSDPAGGPIHVTTEFIIYARASAEACIGSGWFRICKGISVEIPMRFAYRFQIGG